MIIVAATILVLCTVPLFGGKLARVARVRVIRPWTIALAMAVQILIVNVADTSFDHTYAEALHLGSYALAGLFVWWNRKLTGVAVVIAGGMMNLAAIAANGGVMPASATALDAAGKVVNPEEFTNSSAMDDPKLLFLGDVFAWPQPLPLANVFSVGDVVLVVGAGMFLHTTSGSRLSRKNPRHGVMATTPLGLRLRREALPGRR
jgi:hypothetical protein